MVATLEQEFIARLQAPESRHTAFQELVKSYQRVLYHHIRRMVIEHEDTDDVLQNTFVKAWNGIERFRGDSSLKTWLYRIATNEALTFLSKKKKRAYTSLEDAQSEERLGHSGAKDWDGDEIQAKLQAAMKILPERQALVFNLRYFDELPYEEIATITGVTVGALKASYHHAVKKLEVHLTGSR